MGRALGWRSRSRIAAMALLLGTLGWGGAPAATGPAVSPSPTTVAELSPSAWPAPAAGERRWWIPLPSQPSISPDPDLSPDPQQWRLELIVGRFVSVDCNRHQYGGRIRTETLPPRGVTIYRVELGPMVSTRMACPDQPLRRRFISLAGRPYVVPYDPLRSVVVYAPKDVILRWRIWRPERHLQPARPF